jgi:putative transposase
MRFRGDVTGNALAERICMTLPRQVLPGQFYMVTRRCTRREFLLRPDPETNNAFLYCLAYAAERTGVDVILPVVMSNHHHTVVYDRDGSINEFTGHLHKLVAKSQNALRGRWESFWSNEPPSLVRLLDAADIMAKLAYAATNPVKDHLVARVHHWPGLNGLAAFLNGRPLTARRPKHFFRANGPMPESLELHLVIPPELGAPDAVRGQLRDRVAAIERNVAAERAQIGGRVLGRRGVLEQSWCAQPPTPASPRTRRPQLAARSVWARIEAQLRNRDFLTSYRAAWTRWRQGLPSIFPLGTYWLHRFAGVSVAAA